MSSVQPLLLLNQKDPVVLSNTSKPVSGLLMAVRWAPDILGISIPLLVLLTSNWAEAAGVLVPMPTDCADTLPLTARLVMAMSSLFIIDWLNVVG